MASGSNAPARNEEQTTVIGVGTGAIHASVSMGHPSGSFVTRKTKAWHVAQKLADIINTAGASVAGRFGPDQSGVIHAQAWASGPSTGGITLTFVLGTGATARYGKLGNLDRVFVAHGRTLAGVPVGSGQGFQWTAGSGASLLFANGDNNTKYHVTLDFTQTLLDKLGAVVPMSDCRKMYMVFAPRFENVEQELQDGCFLTAGVGACRYDVDGGRHLEAHRRPVLHRHADQRGAHPTAVRRSRRTQITVARGFEASTPGSWPAGARLKKLSPVSGFAGNVEWGCTISNIAVTGDGSLKVGGGSDADRGSGRAMQVHRLLGGLQVRRGGLAVAVVEQGAREAHRAIERAATFARSRSGTRTRASTISTLGRSSTPIAARSPSPSMAWRPRHDLYLNEYGGTTANLKVRGGVAAGNHTVEITARSTRTPPAAGTTSTSITSGRSMPQDVPDAPKVYTDVSLAIDFDTDHGYKKPPAWHLWQLQKLGFKGHADVYMGVFWNNKRRRIDATYPYATVVFSGTPVAGDVVSFSIGGTTMQPRHRVRRDVAGDRLRHARDHQRACSPACGPTITSDRAPRSASNRRRLPGRTPGSR